MSNLSESPCSICLTPLEKNISVLKCNHRYHKDCIQTWRRVNNTCPLCRDPIIYPIDQNKEINRETIQPYTLYCISILLCAFSGSFLYKGFVQYITIIPKMFSNIHQIFLLVYYNQTFISPFYINIIDIILSNCYKLFIIIMIIKLNYRPIIIVQNHHYQLHNHINRYIDYYNHDYYDYYDYYDYEDFHYHDATL